MTAFRSKISESGILGALAPTLEIPPLPDLGAPDRPRRPDLMAEGRRQVLLHLHIHGPSVVAEMRQVRPVSRFFLNLAAAQLIARGLVEAVPESEGRKRGTLRITALGRREVTGG